MTETYIIRSEEYRDRAVRAVQRLPANGEKPLAVTIGPHKPKRSSLQNDRLWEIHSQVSAQLSVMTQCKWKPEDVHEVVFKPRFCGMRELVTPSGRVVHRPKSSTELSKQEMADAQEAYVAWCYQNGIELELLDG